MTLWPGPKRRLSTAFTKPGVQRVGSRMVVSRPADSTAAIRRTAPAETSGAPSSASGRYIPARPRAFVIPPLEGSSAAWAARVSPSPGARLPPVLASIRNGMDAGSVNAACSIGLSCCGSGTWGITRATRASAVSGSPMWKSSPSGSATSWRKKVPSELPVIRRTTSPTRNPKVSPW